METSFRITPLIILISDGYFNLVGITSYSARVYDVGSVDQNGGESNTGSSFGGITPVDAGPTIPAKGRACG